MAALIAPRLNVHPPAPRSRPQLAPRSAGEPLTRARSPPRHYAAVSLAIPLAPQADATRILVFASITAIADAVLRLTASDVPSSLSLHYSGAAEGPGTPFALEMRHLEIESERCQLPYPHLAAARTALLDYFRSASSATASDHHIFRFERTMDLGTGEVRVSPTRAFWPTCPHPFEWDAPSFQIGTA